MTLSNNSLVHSCRGF